MSEMEFNKGTMRRVANKHTMMDFIRGVVTLKDIDKNIPRERRPDFEPNYNLTDEQLWDVFEEEYLMERKYALIGTNLYEMHFEIEGETEPHLAEVEKVSNDSFKFFTYHYNGRASVEEIIGDGLAKIEEL